MISVWRCLIGRVVRCESVDVCLLGGMDCSCEFRIYVVVLDCVNFIFLVFYDDFVWFGNFLSF